MLLHLDNKKKASSSSFGFSVTLFTWSETPGQRALPVVVDVVVVVSLNLESTYEDFCLTTFVTYGNL